MVFATYTITCLLILASFRSVRTTTLIGPWCWAIISLSGMIVVEYLSSRSNKPPFALQYVAAVGLFCPMMSLLGAKRPQDKAWHLIVASLWVVLILPAAESYFIRQGGKLQIHDARGWFLWLLIGTGWLNHALTRYWIACTLLAGAQVLLLAPHLPLLGEFSVGRIWPALLTAAATLIVVASRPRYQTGLERVWLDFRDCFGTFWGVRVAERVNADSQRYDWPVRLEWTGIINTVDSAESHTPTGDHDHDQESMSGLELSLQNLLRRFVSNEWIAERRGMRKGRAEQTPIGDSNEATILVDRQNDDDDSHD